MADSCWVKNVKSYKGQYAHVFMRRCKSCEVQGFLLSPLLGIHGQTRHYGYGFEAQNANSDHLVENNIFRMSRSSFMVGGGVTGCVCGYNCCLNQIQRATARRPENWLTPALTTHGRHSQFNLYEGNIVPKAEFDNIHGSSEHNVVFRNYMSGWDSNEDFPDGIGLPEATPMPESRSSSRRIRSITRWSATSSGSLE
ncbi:MAG: hypothetical protein MZV63_15625 [Marinilabiliales bacterium]|nr:hypothetical protein [Marinilabiliales bacterium]